MTSFSDSDGGRALLRLLSRGHAATQQRLNRLQGCQQIQMNLIQDNICVRQARKQMNQIVNYSII